MDRFSSERLVIRIFQPSDWKDLYDYLSDEEVVYFEPYEPFSKAQAMEEAINRSQNDYFYAVCLRNNQKLVGNLYLAPSDFNTWELGYVFNRHYQRQGYATEGVRALLEYAFNKLGVRRIIAMCNPENERSWKLLERVGMRREGKFIKNIYFKEDDEGNPIWLDTYEYAILKEEWKLKKP